MTDRCAGSLGAPFHCPHHRSPIGTRGQDETVGATSTDRGQGHPEPLRPLGSSVRAHASRRAAPIVTSAGPGAVVSRRHAARTAACGTS